MQLSIHIVQPSILQMCALLAERSAPGHAQ